MRCHDILLRILIAIAVVPLCAQAPAPADREQVLGIEASWNDAIRRSDATTVAALVAPDFELVVSPTQVVTRAAMLSGVANPGRTIAENGSRAQNVRTYGDTAVVTGIYFERGRVENRTYAFESRYTDVYVRRGASWMADSAHASQGPVNYGDNP